MIKFNRYHVTNGTAKARVHYSLATLINGRVCVTLYAKDGINALAQIFDDHRYENNTDLMTDYFEKGRVRIYENDPLFPAAKAQAVR